MILFAVASAAPFTQNETITVTVGANEPVFTPLHTYYLSRTGSDSNNGLSPTTAWATPNHPVVCGDVIIAAAGAYNTQFDSTFGTVSNCPSTTGGIDGAGGIYFAILLCGGADLEACFVNNNVTSPNGVFAITTSNWSVQGFKVTGPNNRGFMANTPALGTVIHHFAFVNNVIYDANTAFSMNDCPAGNCNHNVPGQGSDYWAAVGNIAQNSGHDPICVAAIDVVGPSWIDSAAGTHYYVYGNFAIHSRSPSCATLYDGEGIMFDTFDAHGTPGQGVIQNNISLDSERYGIQIYSQNFNAFTSKFYVFNNTTYGNLAGSGTTSPGDYGEIQLQPDTVAGTNPPTFVYNNISQARWAVQRGTNTGANIEALLSGGQNPSGSVLGGTGRENILFGINGQNLSLYNGATAGTNFLGVDPQFTNLTDLVNNRLTAIPNCTGYRNATACMGWNAVTQTLTTPSVISDLKPNCSQCSGKGYQLSSTTCAANSFYPVWLKGIVHLEVRGSQIVQAQGLVTKPCGL